MRLVEFLPQSAEPITLFESVAASSVPLGDGSGEAHVYCLYFGPGSSIGAHPTGFDQLFLVVSGEGWASGNEGERVSLRAGQGVYFECGEMHVKGSATGMTVIIVQVTHLTLRDKKEKPST